MQTELQKNVLTNILRKPKLSDIPVCIMLFLASRASVMGVYPFAVAMYCATFDKNVSYLAIITTLVGALSTFSGFECVKYILAIVLFWLFSCLKEDYPKTRIFSSVICASCVFAGGCLVMICDTGAVYDFVALVIEAILCAIMYVVFSKAVMIFNRRRNRATRTELICGAICVGVFISGIANISLFGVNLSHIIISYIVMSIALSGDVAIAGSGGICTGMVCSLNEVASVTLIGFYGMAGTLCSLMRSFKKYGVALGFLGSGCVILLYVGNSFNIPVSILEMMIACSIFVCIPEKLHKELSSRIVGIISPEITEEDSRAVSYIDERLVRVADAFSALSNTFRTVSDKRLRKFHREAASIVQESVERICKNCADCSRCWQDNFGHTWKLAFSLLDTYEKKGFCTVKNSSAEFVNNCIIPEKFLAEFNHAYELFRIETIHKGEAVLARDLISEQYSLFSDIAYGLADRLRSGFSSDKETELLICENLSERDISVRDVKVVLNDNTYEIYLCTLYNHNPDTICDIIGDVMGLPVFFEESLSQGVMKFSTAGVYKTSVGVSQIPKHGENVCGDSVFRFKSDNKYYVIICDGMGSGASARSESLLTGSLLQRFLEAGLGAKTAITMVNSSLALKQDHEMFSSVDMMVLDLVSGKAEFFKIGGTRSFIRHDDEVETVFCESLPLGILDGISTVSVTKTLGDDDIVVMMSDGVSDTEFGVFTSEKMKKLVNDEEKTMDELSDAVLGVALKRRNHIAHDDMTVVAIQLKKAI